MIVKMEDVREENFEEGLDQEGVERKEVGKEDFKEGLDQGSGAHEY